MESFNFDNLSSSINAQLNHGIQVANKGNSHLQTGKKINEAKDDVGAFSVNAKINAELKQKTQRVQNLQNSLSFLQVQDGALKSAGNILIEWGSSKPSSKLQPSMVQTRRFSTRNSRNYRFSSRRSGIKV